MVSQTIVLNLDGGLNPKNVQEISNYLRNFSCAVTMKHDGRIANCKSLISLINLGAAANARVEVAAEGTNEEQELADFIKFLEKMSKKD